MSPNYKSLEIIYANLPKYEKKIESHYIVGQKGEGF